MKGFLVDSNVILDLFLNDSEWGNWSESVLAEYAQIGTLCINSIIYAEVSIGFETIEKLETAIEKAGFQLLEIPKEALFLAGKVFGQKTAPLPDFFIGAHAAVLGLDLITRDKSRYGSYFPTVELIAP